MPPDETKKPVYDPKKTRDYLKVAGGFESHPLGEFVAALAAQLTLAEEALGDMRGEVTTAINARNKAEGDLETAQATIHRLRNGATGMNELIDALKAIARNPKGAKAVATEALAKVEGKGAT
jgi:hypothetical protein